MAVPGVSPGHGEVREALRSIVADPDYGVEALSSRRAMESLLKDLLPDKPRDAAILVAAAEHGIASRLRERVGQEGMDAGTAIRLVAAMFAKPTAFTPEACEWAVTELAVAQRMDVTAAPPTLGRPAAPVPSAVTTPPPGVTVPPSGITVPPPAEAAHDDRATLPGEETAVAPRPIVTPPGYGSTAFPAPAAQQPRRRAVWYVVAGAAAVAIAAGAIVALHKSPLPTPVIALTVASPINPVDGNVYVEYQDRGYSTASITATVTNGAKGEVAELTGQQFPFTRPPAVIKSAGITGQHQRVTFRFSPSLESRLRIVILPSAGASKPLAESPVRTVYVTLIGRYKYIKNTCTRPKCYVTIRVQVPVPHAALQPESAKHVDFYWGINLVASGPEPAAPSTLYLESQITTSEPTVVGSDKYQFTVPIRFTVGQDAYHWRWNICTQANVSADGIGLPGNGQCGSAKISAANPGYLGSLAG